MQVRLTPKALELVDDMLAAHLANEARLLASLPAEERARTGAALCTLLRSLGGTDIT